MPGKELPRVEYTAAQGVPDSTAIYDRDGGLIIVNLDKPNDYSGEFINTGLVCISLDSNMVIEDMEIKFSTGEAEVIPNLQVPPGIPATVHFQDSFLEVEQVSSLKTNPDSDLVFVCYEVVSDEEKLCLQVAGGVFFEITLDNRLAGIWVKDLIAR